MGSKTCAIIFLGLRSEVVDVILVVVLAKETCGVMTCRMNNYEID